MSFFLKLNCASILDSDGPLGNRGDTKIEIEFHATFQLG